MVLVTLLYENGTRFFVGGFNTLEEASSWIAEEKTRPYWKETTQIEVVDK